MIDIRAKESDTVLFRSPADALAGADLAGLSLPGADLAGADLRGADLRGADLCKARLGGADLQPAGPGRAGPPKAGPTHAGSREAFPLGGKLPPGPAVRSRLERVDGLRASFEFATLRDAAV